ncbi:MAG TPA: ABC transporter ATP-binding protein [Acidimicrobiales bacterium]
MSLLAVEDLNVSYGAVQALRGLSLTVERGEMVALLGANGAGKTTTLRTISGLLAPRSGTITFEDERIDGQPAYNLVGRGVAHLPEGRDLFPSLTVEENLKYGHWTRRRDKADYRARLDEVMEHFPRLRERRGQIAKTLSGGEQQMLGVARALMSSPKLLLIDELSLGLAPLIVRQLFEILDGVNRAGTSVLLVEQFVHMALAHTHRAYVLAKGEVVLEGDSSELAGNPDLIASYLGEGTAPEPPKEPASPRRRRTRA